MKKLIPFILLLLLSCHARGEGNSRRNDSVDILRYVFRLTLSDNYDTISAQATITLRLLALTDSVGFDLRSRRSDGKGMKVSSVTLGSGRTSWVHRNDRVTIPLSSLRTAGEEMTVTIAYSGVPADGLVISTTRFGKRSFFADHWPDRASHYLPCVDHPSDKAAVEFIITAPEHYSVVSNGSLVEEKSLPEGMKTTHWREDVPIPLKVTTFGAADFAISKAGEVAGVPVWTYVYPENRNEGFADYALAVHPMQYYSDLIGPYPYPKLANVQSKTMFGGLENAGAIFYSESSVTGTGRSEGLIAHEIAHQWFGNSVTEADWHHIWLSEGFATYLTSMYWEMKEGPTRMKSEMRSARERVLRASERNPAPVIDTTITDLMRLLSANSYQKGAWVLHMLRNRIGDEAFTAGLRLYYTRYNNSNALTSDFMSVMEEVSGQRLGDFFHQWLYVPGQPDIKISWIVLADGRIEITVNQMQDHIFKFPLELEIVCDSGSRRVSEVIESRSVRLMSELPGKPVEIIPDPDVRLLFREAK